MVRAPYKIALKCYIYRQANVGLEYFRIAIKYLISCDIM